MSLINYSPGTASCNLDIVCLVFKKKSVNAQCLRTKLSTGDATCLGVCMNAGDHCALVCAGGIETECENKMVRGEMHGHSEESSPGNKGEEKAPRKGDFCSKVEMLA